VSQALDAPSSALDPVADALRRGGLRVTGARSEVLGRLVGRRRPVAANELHAELRRDGLRIGLTTVYGTLLPLASNGVLHSFTEAGETGYRWCSAAAHHHAVCTRCGIIEEFSAPEADRRIELAARRHGFLVVRADLDVEGLCASCAPRNSRRRRGETERRPHRPSR
jgi:Fur family ferric uptake transcriptional regulator